MQVKQIIPKSVVLVPISAEFYNRLQAALVYLTSLKTDEELQAAIDAMEQKKELNEFEETFETLLVLSNELEGTFIQEGMIHDVEIPDPVNNS